MLIHRLISTQLLPDRPTGGKRRRTGKISLETI